jgi:hypothetical protein
MSTLTVTGTGTPTREAIERETCQHKKPFPSRMAAEHKLAVVRTIAKRTGELHLYDRGGVYQCRVCFKWHLTKRMWDAQ